MQHVKIIDCNATDCAFNREGTCHALAITVGDGMERKCDTYWKASNKGGALDIVAEVGACRASACKFNEDFLCTAEGIHVGHSGDEVDCLSFQSG